MAIHEILTMLKLHAVHGHEQMFLEEAYNLHMHNLMFKERFCTCPTLHCRKINSETYLLVSLAGLMHTLSLVRGPVTWIVIEAGGVSNSTAQFLAQARVHNVVHLGYPTLMPVAFEARWILESHLRVEGLR